MIVLLHGPDTFRLKQKLGEIVQSYTQAHHGQVRSFFFDCKETSIEEVQTACETMSLFENKKLIVLRNAVQTPMCATWLYGRRKELHEKSSNVVVVVEEGEIKEKTKNQLYQWLVKHAKVQEFKPLSLERVRAWIVQMAATYGLHMTPGAQELLVRAAGSDLWRMKQEIIRLAAYTYGSSSSQVQEGDVATFVQGGAEADVFATIEAAARKNKKQALALLYRHIQKGDAPAYLLSMIVYQFRTILGIRDLLDRGVMQRDIARHANIHPYVAQKGIRAAEAFSLGELRTMYNKLWVLDRDTKTGRARAQGSLDMFVVTL